MFRMRLALALGKTLKELRESMDPDELSDWQAFAEIEPFGEQRADIRAAMVAHAVAVYAGKIAKGKPKLSDFLPFAGKVKRPRQSAEEQKAIILAMLAMARESKPGEPR